ncbi:MAG: glycosyltransferase family 39 protein [Acidobacteriota bacterium]|nr:glycosyltransferase family 39 protein [Acidobacteriota bacterium]
MARDERLTLIGIAVLSLVVHAVAYFRYRFDSDEPQHLHVAWGWTAGLLQYRDLFDNHAPLFHILTAPLLKLVGERPDVLLYMRAPMVLLFAVVIWSTYIVGRRLYSEWVAIWAALMLSLFPIYFLKSIEYRTDNLWIAFWCLAIVVMTGGPLTPLRMFAVGLLLGCAAATSMKTMLLVMSLAAAALVTWFVTRQWRNVLPAFVGLLVVPSIVSAYFAAQGAWKNLLYCVIHFNTLIQSSLPPEDVLVRRLAYIPLLLLILWITWLKRPSTEDPQTRWRFFLAFTSAFFSITLFSFWVLISPRDYMVMLPIAAIFFAAALDRLDIRLPLYIATCFVFTGSIWFYTHGFEDGTTEHVTMMRQVLGVTRPGEPLLDLKGETIYRPRPYYYIFEYITRRLLRSGVIVDTIPEDVVRTQCHVVQADGPFFPPRGRAFLQANFIDLGRLRAAGQWLEDDGSFTIAVPGEYFILTSNGQAHGDLDGSPYRGASMLAPGRHIFVTTGTKELSACLWAPAFLRGYSPFNLRDREFPGSPIFDSPDYGPGAASGRRRHRGWGPHPARPGKRR